MLLSIAGAIPIGMFGLGILLLAVAACHLPALIALVLAAHAHAAGWLLAVIAVCGAIVAAVRRRTLRARWRSGGARR